MPENLLAVSSDSASPQFRCNHPLPNAKLPHTRYYHYSLIGELYDVCCDLSDRMLFVIHVVCYYN